MVTIYDIAKKVGCAPSTVSKALNNQKEVSGKRKEEILAVAKAMGYVPNSSARRLASKRSWSIGVLFSEDLNIGLEHHFFGGVLQAFKSYVERLGYEVTFVSNQIGAQSLTYLEWCRHKNIDGVLIVSVDVKDDNLKELTHSEVPIVSVDNGLKHIPTIVSDNFSGTAMAMGYLVASGAKRIAHIAGPLRSYASVERLQAYKDALITHEIKEDQALVVEAKNFDFLSGKHALNQLFDQIKDPPDALYAASDDIALGAIAGLREKGYRVPEDVSVIGFDNIELSGYTSPSLTTIAQDKRKIGVEAAKYLIALINQEAEDYERNLRVPVELIVRESTK